MIVLDSSAVIAIARQETDGPAFQKFLMAAAEDLVLPSSQYLEIAMVLRTAGVERFWLEGFLSRYAIRIVPVTESTARFAADAFERFGKGTGHPARLNFGDCLAYAVAQEMGAPLLFKGDDFSFTDVRPAVQVGNDAA